MGTCSKTYGMGVETTTALLEAHEAIEMYKNISEELADIRLLNRLKQLFKKRFTLLELLEWIHIRVKFSKGEIVRHNDPFEIIEYGQGKCREFSILFAAVCMANDYRARLVLDMSDHAWVEVWDTKRKSWTHVDPSEKRVNDPEMYERDWKKNLKGVYAFEKGVLEDVTGSYKIRGNRSE